jgi:Uma2 family endonuclease
MESAPNYFAIFALQSFVPNFVKNASIMVLDASKTKKKREIDTYKLERNKPIPSLDHSLIQLQLGHLLKRDYNSQFSLMSELALDTLPKGTTPDICIYPKMNRELGKQPDVVKMTQMPITTVEILSASQPIAQIIPKINEYYFPAGVKSAWVIIPELLAIVLYSPEKEDYEWFKSGKMTDPATGITVDVKEVFDVD